MPSHIVSSLKTLQPTTRCLKFRVQQSKVVQLIYMILLINMWLSHIQSTHIEIDYIIVFSPTLLDFGFILYFSKRLSG